MVGPLTIKNEKALTATNNFQLTFLGKSVVEAYSICEKQNWSGCVITDTCIDIYRHELSKILPLESDPSRLEKLVSIESLEKRFFIKKYLAPYKEGKIKEDTNEKLAKIILNLMLKSKKN